MRGMMVWVVAAVVLGCGDDAREAPDGGEPDLSIGPDTAVDAGVDASDTSVAEDEGVDETIDAADAMDANIEPERGPSPFASQARAEERCEVRFPELEAIDVPDEGGIFTGDTAEGGTDFECPSGGRSVLYRVGPAYTRYYRLELVPASDAVDVNLHLFNSCRDSGACGIPAGTSGPGETETQEIFVAGHDEDSYILVTSPPGTEGAYELRIEDLGAVLQFVAEEITLPLNDAEASETVGLDLDETVSTGGERCDERPDRTSEDVPGGGVDNEASPVLFAIQEILGDSYDPNEDIAEVIARGRYLGIEITGVNDLENDDDVRVTLARVHSTERNRLDDVYLPFESDDDGFILPGQGVIVRDPVTQVGGIGRITDGLLEADISLLLEDAVAETGASYMALAIPGLDLTVRRAILRMNLADNYIQDATIALELPLEPLVESLPDLEFLETTLGEAADLRPNEAGVCEALSGAVLVSGPWMDYRFYFGFDADCERFCARSATECENESMDGCMDRCRSSRERDRRCGFAATTCAEVAACEL
ncbi:MAG: hypothetical protein AAF411_17985 [Myxococcota bacterium]